MSASSDALVLHISPAVCKTQVLRLRRYFARRAPAREIDDLIQEVFLRIQAQANRAPIRHLEGYLVTVAASVLVDRARRRLARRESTHLALEDAHHPRDHLTPERVLLDQEALSRIMDAIMQLPARTRDTFILHRFEDMSCAAIAEHLGITVSGVEKHIMRALHHLHSMLDGV